MNEEIKETVEPTEAVSTDTNAVENAATEPQNDGKLFKPTTPYETAIAQYLEKTASAALVEKIKAAKKAGYGIRECYHYIYDEARKEAKGGNCAMIEDSVVFGWAVHFFEDEWQATEKQKAAEKARVAKKKAEAAAKKKAAEEAEAARIAAMTPEERELEERAKIEAAAAADLAKIDEERAKIEAKEREKEIKKHLKQIEKEAYECCKRGETILKPSWTDEEKKSANEGMKKWKWEQMQKRRAEAEAKAAAKKAAADAQLMLFDFNAEGGAK